MNFQNPQHYSEKATIQRLVAKRLVEFAKDKIASAEYILDIGCGTGFIAEEILDRFGQKKIDGLEPSPQMAQFAKPKYNKIINCKAEDFPFPGQKYDLFLSSMAMQWALNPEEQINKISAAADFCFAVPLFPSLNELRLAFNLANAPCPLLNFPDLSIEPVYVWEAEQKFSSILSALKHFNSIGAVNDAFKPNVLSHNQIKQANKHFKQVATWRIGFFQLTIFHTNFFLFIIF
jgi:SAM-dependent methyltransferase